MAAKITEPCVGACVCASGSQVWNGNIGTLTAKPMNIPAKIQICTLRAIAPPFSTRYGMAKLSAPVLKNNARNATSMSAEPNMVYKKNLSDAYWRFSPPHTPIMKYIGNKTSSKNTKNKMRSCAMNVPAIPVCNTSIKMKNAFGLPGDGMWLRL